MKIATKTKKRVQKMTIIFAIAFFIFVILIASITTAYFSNTKLSQGQVILGELDFCISSTQIQNNIVVPNMFVGQSTSISNSRNADGSDYNGLCKILYKFSVYVLIDGQVDYDIANCIDFYIDNTKYIQSGNEFYYVGFLTPGQREIIFNDVFLNCDIGNLYQNKQINFVISAVAIQAENDAYLDLWRDAPTQWKSQIESILQ